MCAFLLLLAMVGSIALTISLQDINNKSNNTELYKHILCQCSMRKIRLDDKIKN